MKPFSPSIWVTPLSGIALLGTLALPASQVHADTPTTTKSQVGIEPGKLMLRFQSGISAQEKKRVLAQVKGAIKRTYSTGWALVEVPQSSTLAAINKLKSLSQVDGAEPDRKWKMVRPTPAPVEGAPKQLRSNTTSTAPIPNDPLYSQQWALQRINAPEAWKTTTGSKDIVIADMDTGINLTHQDLTPNLFNNTAELNGKAGVDDDKNGFVDDVHGWNSFSSNGNVQDVLSNGHGSHTAGIIGAAGNNKQLISGVNWQATLVPIAVLSADDELTTHSIAEGVDYILALRKQGVNVRAVNCSFGETDTAIERTYYDSFKALNDAGVLIICSAGNASSNSDKTSHLPSGLDLPNIISVGASNYADERWESSSYGLQSVDIFAPGASILSTLHNSPTALATYNGTSMAAPMVTGAAALLWASQPSLTAAQVKQRLLASAKRVERLRPFVKEGRRLDVGALLNNAVHTIVGGTVTSDGKTRTAVGGVSIYLDDHTGTPDAITNAKGVYTMLGVAGGSHTVRAELNGQPFGRSVKLNLTTSKAANPGTAKANFEQVTPQSKRYSLYGYAEQLFPGGETKPKGNVDVYLNDSTVPFARTDAKGNFKISNLAEGSYVVRMIDALNGEKASSLQVVHLPITQPRDEGIHRYSPDGYAPATFSFIDRLVPFIESANIKKDFIFTPQTAPKFFAGTVADDSAVASMNIVLYRYLPDFSIVEMYDMANKEWVNWFTSAQVSAGSITGNGQARVAFRLPLPALDPSYHYEIDAFSIDAFGRDAVDTFLFTFQNPSSPSTQITSANPSAGSG